MGDRRHPSPRRQFLRTSALAGAAVSLGRPAWPRPAAGNAAAEGEPLAPSWIDKPMRWAQLTLVEDDPGKFDLAVLARLLQAHALRRRLPQRRRLRGLLPDEVPFHHRSAWLGDRDVFGELVAGCRKLGMVVIARTDPHATYDDVQAAHPDWIAVDADGKPRRHWASPEMWVTCGLGPYNFEFMTEVKREIMSRYRVDGIFINRWDGSGMCYCEHCRNELPRRHRPRAAAHRRPAGPGAARLHPVAAASGSSTCGASGTRRSARSIPTRASSRTPAAAPPVRWT